MEVKLDAGPASAHDDLLWQLIGEDLKACRLGAALHELGCDNYYVPDLSDIVLAAAGFGEASHDLYHFYEDLLARRSATLNGSDHTLTQAVAEVYTALIVRRAHLKAATLNPDRL